LKKERGVKWGSGRVVLMQEEDIKKELSNKRDSKDKKRTRYAKDP